MIRSPYRGLLEIFHYNRPFYIRTLAGVIAATVLSMWLPPALRALLLAAAALRSSGLTHLSWSRTTSTIDLRSTASTGCPRASRAARTLDQYPLRYR